MTSGILKWALVRGAAACVAIALVTAHSASPRAAVAEDRGLAKLATYQTKYYTIHTDLDKHGVREADLRLTLMAEEYHRRLAGLAGTVRERQPFYLFKDARDYYAAGGIAGSAGVFTGDKLMAIADPRFASAVWATVQHEGFHQFVMAAVGDRIPIWANEGLAEYFGEAMFCGDRIVSGLARPEQVKNVQKMIRAGEYESLADMLAMSHRQWNAQLKHGNYIQAWSMIHFLAHADGGRYQDAFIGFLRDVSKQTDAPRAWKKHFGEDTGAFERRWREYWLELPEDATADLYAEAVLSTLTSFYARARAMRQSFDSVEEFLVKAKDGDLKVHEKDWLPPAILAEALAAAESVGEWSLGGTKSKPVLAVKLPGGKTLEGNFTLRGERVSGVDIKSKKGRK